MEIDISPKGVEAIRAYADAMPIAIDSIVNDTEELVRVYHSVLDMIGIHEAQFSDMVQLINSAQKNAAESIQALIPKLRATADDMEEFIRNKPQISGKQ